MNYHENSIKNEKKKIKNRIKQGWAEKLIPFLA